MVARNSEPYAHCMRYAPEHRSRPAPGLFAACLLLCSAPAAHAQVPTCAWGDGVVLAKTGDRKLLLSGDGGAGLLVVSCPENWFDAPPAPQGGPLRLHHVLEQGRLDPSQPDSGVTFYTPPDPTDYQGTDVQRVLADGAGGAFVLTRACNPKLAHTRCWEHSTLRLLHVTGAGATAPGWPAAGALIPALPEIDAHDSGDIVADGAGGVIAAWIKFDPDSFLTPSVRAQRYSAAGAALWSGEQDGLVVLGAALQRQAIRVAGDGAGGAAIVVSGTAATGGIDLFASRVLANGALPWGTAGKPVMLQPSYSLFVQGAAMDAGGRLFVSARLSPIAGGATLFATQLLTTAGVRAWTSLGVVVGDAASVGPIPAVCSGDEYVTLHRDGAGSVRFQAQDITATPLWGAEDAGLIADWCNGVEPPAPIAMSDGDLVSVWADPESIFGGPPMVVHAMELGPGGVVAPGWPATGVVVCGGRYGLTPSDAISVDGQLFVGFGNDYFPGPTPRVQRLTRAVLGVGPPEPGPSLVLSSASPNPTRGPWSLQFALPDHAEVT